MSGESYSSRFVSACVAFAVGVVVLYVAVGLLRSIAMYVVGALVVTAVVFMASRFFFGRREHW